MKNFEIFEFVKQYDNFEDFEKQLFKNPFIAEKMVMLYHFEGYFLPDYVAYTGAIENIKGNFIPLKDEDFYETNIRDGNKEGYSDLKFKHKKDGSWLLYSCKIFTKQNKTLYSFEFSKLKEVAQEIKKKYGNVKIELCIISNYNKDEIKKGSKINESFNMKHSIFREDLITIFENLKNMSYVQEKKKKKLNCRFYQDYFISNITKDFENDYSKILLDSVPRTGKTFMAMNIVNNLRPKNVIFVSNIKTNLKDGIKESIKENLNEEYKEHYYCFDKLTKEKTIIQETNYSESCKFKLKTGKRKGEKCGIKSKKGSEYCSSHYKKMYETVSFQEETEETQENIEEDTTNINENEFNFIVTTFQSLNAINFNLKMDMIIIDEAHLGILGNVNNNIIKKMSKKSTRILFMTGTCSKPIFKYPDIKIYSFSLENINKLKERDEEELKNWEQKLGRKPLRHELERDIDIFPDIQFVDTYITEHFKKDYDSFRTEDGTKFSVYENMFCVKDECFSEEAQKSISNFLDKIFVRKDSRVTGKLTMSKINNERREKGGVVIIKVQAGKKDKKTKDVLPVMAKLFQDNYDNTKYNVLYFSSHTNNKNIIQQIEEAKKQNLKEGQDEKMVIVFVYKMLETSITIPGCFCTILMDNDYNFDSYYQFFMRCFTPEKDKNKCYVIDINPFRRTSFQVDYITKTRELKNMFNIKNYITEIFDIVEQDLETKLSNERLDLYLQHYYNSYYKRNLINNIQLDDFLRIKPGKISKTILSKEPGIESTESTQEITENTQKEKQKETSKDQEDEEEKMRQYSKEIFNFSLRVLVIQYITKNKNFDTEIDEKIYQEIRDNVNSVYGAFFKYEDWIRNFKTNSNIFYSIFNNFQMSLKDDNMESKLKIIMNFLKPNEIQKKKTGEVYTPPDLINEMLDKLEEYNPGIFSDPDKTWYDNSCGIGNFLVFVYLRLNKGLETVIKDPLERKNHILNRMIYGVDICPLNISICKFLLGCRENDNIICGDGLSQETHKGMTFDIIVGNPPYQAEQNNTTKRGGGDLLWNKFLLHSLNTLKKNGFLCYIHPSGWRKPQSERSKYKNLFQTLTNNNTMLYLEMHNTKDGLKTFQSGTRYDWYIVKNIKNKGIETVIKDENGHINNIKLEEWKFLPNSNLNLIQKFLGTGCNVIYNVSSYETRKEWVTDNKNEVFKYCLIHSTNKSGIRYMYSSRKDKGHFGIPKIIFGETGINDIVIDLEGKYGMTQHAIAIQINNKEEALQMKKFLLNNKFKSILESCSWSNFMIDWRLFTYFKKDFYKEFL